MKTFRHGDINFHRIENLIEGKEIKHSGSFVFGLGETTGHKHVITVERETDLRIYDTNEGRVYELLSPGKLSHEEHNDIWLPAGIYIQKQEIEKDWFSLTIRNVID